MSHIVLIDGKPRSSCHRAEIECTKDYTDTHVFVVDEADTDDGGNVTAARYSFVKTYDGMDGENWAVKCRECGEPINQDNIDFQQED